MSYADFSFSLTYRKLHRQQWYSFLRRVHAWSWCCWTYS